MSCRFSGSAYAELSLFTFHPRTGSTFFYKQRWVILTFIPWHGRTIKRPWIYSVHCTLYRETRKGWDFNEDLKFLDSDYPKFGLLSWIHYLINVRNNLQTNIKHLSPWETSHIQNKIELTSLGCSEVSLFLGKPV